MAKICPISNARCREAECEIYDEAYKRCSIVVIARALKDLVRASGGE